MFGIIKVKFFIYFTYERNSSLDEKVKCENNYIFFLVTGLVKLTKNNKKFTIMSDCESVHVSSMKLLKKKDDVTIEDIRYIGSNSEINQVVPTNFTISMESDSSISLEFNCTQWGEWKAFDDDGTCRTAVMKPLYNSKNVKGLLKYKRNETCSKFL